MSGDASNRKLEIPPRFLPYLEKHRIYELFHDLANELAMIRPQDPLSFLRTCLGGLGTHRDKRLVFLIAPPFLDRIKLAQLICQKTGYDILSRYICVKNPYDYHSPLILARNVSEHLGTSDQKDWVAADFPNTDIEAKELIKEGILPSHTFLFVSEDSEDGENDNHKEEKLKKIDATPSIMMDYENDLYRLKELYKSSIKVVKIKDKSLEELADACAKVAVNLPPRNAPKMYRVVLLGPRGSRRRTIARLICRQMNVVHVDMEQLLNATRVAKTAEGDRLRFQDKNGYSYSLKTVFNILKERLSKEDCKKRGWVLTNFPTSVEDFILLDSLDTPPNRVIFLDINETECQERLEDRMVNMHTGKLHSRKTNPNNPNITTHPDDESCKVENEIRFYKERIGAIKEYCGRTAFVVDARGSINALLERVENVLMGPAPEAPPRTRRVPKDRPRLGSETSTESRLGFPPRPSQTEVVPLIESAELLRRFSDLKKRVQIRHDSSSSEEGDLITRELDKEFELALMGGSLHRNGF